jgi:hypothetical protein
MVWRMIYNNVDVVDLFQTSDITITPYNIFEGRTIDECFDKIDELQLVYHYTTEDDSIIIFSGGTRTIVSKQ